MFFYEIFANEKWKWDRFRDFYSQSEGIPNNPKGYSSMVKELHISYFLSQFDCS